MRLPLTPRSVSLAAAVAAMTLTFVARGAPADEGAPMHRHRPMQPQATKPIDLVLCLDTSGSMQGLIDAARTKLWEVVNEMARAKPTPSLRVALLTYGSPGDAAAGYVVLQTGFTKDLDLVSEKLFALGTNGGEEYVGRVVKTAVDRLEWGGPDALKILFVAGNEGADQDTVANFRDVVRHASGLGVRVNSIYCGNPDDAVAPGWREVATLGRGRFASIDHDRGTVVVATPFDKELQDLSGKVNVTYVGYGRLAKAGEERQRAQDANAAGAAPAAAADRAQSKASGLYSNAGWDLVDRSKEKDFDLAKVSDEDLPEEMKKMTLEQKRAHLDAKSAEREQIQARIREVSAKRAEFVKAEMANKGLDDGKALDRAIREAIHEEAAEKGFTFDSPK
jgi:hypothetical protein